MKLRLGSYTNISVQNVLTDGAADAGIYVGGASNFALTDVTVQNTRADAINMTTSSHDGTVTRPRVINPGDDGVAVVSCRNDSEYCAKSPFSGLAWKGKSGGAASLSWVGRTLRSTTSPWNVARAPASTSQLRASGTPTASRT